MPAQFLQEIIFIIIAAFIGGFIAQSLRFPSVLGFIGSGIIFGVIGKNTFQSYDSLVALSQIGVSLLLFTLGFEISLDVIKKINKKVFLIGILQVLLSAFVLFPLFLFLNFSASVSILLSLLLSFSSTVVIIKALEEKGLVNNFPGNNVFIILLIQDFFVIPVIFLLPLLFSKGTISPNIIINLLLSGIKPLIIFTALFVFSKIFLSRFLTLLFRYPSHELIILATIGLAALSIGLLKIVGVPESIAAFLTGALISDRGKNLAPLSEIRPVRDILLVLFFVTTGMLVDFSFVMSHLPLLALLATAVLFIRFFTLFLLLLAANYHPSAAVFISGYLTNIGEFAIVIGQIAFLSHFIQAGTYNLLLSVFISSLLTTPLWIHGIRFFQEKVIRSSLLSPLFHNHRQRLKNVNDEMQNHVIICGHGRVGREIRNVLDIAEIPYITIDFDKKIIDKLLKMEKVALFGDPTEEEVLQAARIKHAKAIVITIPDSHSQKKIIKEATRLNPKMLIFCRSHIEEDRLELVHLGADSIVIPEFEAGLKIGGEVLEVFEWEEHRANTFINKLREERMKPPRVTVDQ